MRLPIFFNSHPKVVFCLGFIFYYFVALLYPVDNFGNLVPLCSYFYLNLAYFVSVGYINICFLAVIFNRRIGDGDGIFYFI